MRKRGATRARRRSTRTTHRSFRRLAQFRCGDECRCGSKVLAASAEFRSAIACNERGTDQSPFMGLDGGMPLPAPRPCRRLLAIPPLDAESDVLKCARFAYIRHMPLGLAWPRRAVSRQVQCTLFCPSPSFRQTPAWTQALGLLGFERLRRCEQLHHSRGCHAQHSPHKMRMHRSTTCTICAIPFKPRDASCAAFTMHCNACSLATRHWLSQTIPVVTHCAGRARGVPARNTRRASRCGPSGARLWPL